jgi:hypothetical protein
MALNGTFLNKFKKNEVYQQMRVAQRVVLQTKMKFKYKTLYISAEYAVIRR